MNRGPRLADPVASLRGNAPSVILDGIQYVPRLEMVGTMRLSNLLIACLMCSLGSTAEGEEVEPLTISPRWGTMWLSPRLNGNWVVLRYRHTFEKGKEPGGTVTVDLPAGVSLLAPLWGKPQQTELPGGATRSEIDVVKVTGSATKLPLVFLCVATTLEPGAEAEFTISAAWEDGKMPPKTFPIRVMDVPVGRQPEELVTGAAIWPYQVSNWPDFFKQYASLGFNLMDYWEGTIHDTTRVNEKLREQTEAARQEGIGLSVNASGSWDMAKIAETPDAQAVYGNTGKSHKQIPCPSYRGPGCPDKLRFNAEIARSGVSHIQSDEELYGNTGAGAHVCICSRCETRWKEWLARQYPELEYASPGAVYKSREDYPEHYRAWVWFMASLTTERYRIYKGQIEKAVKGHGANSSSKPLLSWWAGAAEDATLMHNQQDARGLAQTIDYLFPQLYYRYKIRPRHFREAIRRHCWAVDGRGACAGIDTDDHFGDANTPGVLTASVLETLFAGGKGYCLWYGPYMDTRQWAELARANDVIAGHERTFLEGRETDLFRAFVPVDVEGLPKSYFRPSSPDVCTATWESGKEGLLLLTDYRAQREPFWVERSLKYAGPMTLVDAFTDERVVHLTEGRWDFRVHLRELPVRMLYWRKSSR